MGSSTWYSKEIQDLIARDRERRVEELRAKAWDRARKVAEFLKTVYRVSGVVLYGSLAEGYFGRESDIDLMVEGFSGSYWEMYREAALLAEPFELSIVCKEDAVPSLVEHVLQKGVRL